MTLDHYRGTMRRAAVVLAVLLAGCPASHDPNQTGDDTSGDAGVPDGPGSDETCANPVPSCSATITYKGTGTTVTLMGDFADDGWTNGIAMTKNADGTFSADVPALDEQVIVYKFVVDGNWIADPDNPRKSPDTYGAFNSVTRVDCDHCPKAAPRDWRDGIMYFVMVDRFADGDPSNNAPVSGVETPGQYQGGDFAGVRQKIESGYFDDLHVNTLWITSPLDNTDRAFLGADGHMYTGYHGYWPADEEQIEARMGGEAELAAMIDAAHKHHIQVLVDYVMNHVHVDSPIYAQHPEWFWPDDNGNGGNCVCGQGCSWDTDRLKCWFDTFLPDFNFTNPDARRWSVENAVSWAKRLHIDGFRLDAVKHIETSWLLDLRARIQAEVAWDQPFYMVGETFDGDRGLIKSYVDPDTMLDGQFDFPLRGSVLSTVLHRSGSMGDLAGFLDSNDGFYGSKSVMSTFLGNHDVPRAIEHALDSPMFDPWDGGKQNAWFGQPAEPSTAAPFERLSVAYALIFTIPGIPMLYYGDEYGMAGAGDPDNRRFMQWDSYTADQQHLRDTIAALGKIRSEHAATRRGTRTTLGSTQDQLTYKVETSGDTVFVALNRGDGTGQPPNLPPGNYTDLVTGKAMNTPITMAPRSALVLVAQ